MKQIARAIEPRSKLLRAWRLQGGSSASMTALEIECAGGQTLRVIVRRPGDQAVRRNPHAARDEFKLLQLAQSFGLPAPAPIHLDESSRILPAPYLVISYMEGELQFAPGDRAGYIAQFAAHLAKIHSVDGSKPDLSFLPQFDSGLAGSFERGAPGERGAPEPRGLAKPEGALDARNIRDVLASACPWPRRNAPVLLHGDFWPGNILWRAGTLIAVIDWEDAATGDPLADLAISRLDILCIFGVDAMQAFTNQYRSLVAIDDTELPYWDLWAALRLARLAGSNLADWASFFAPYGRPDITERTIREQYKFLVAQALEKLLLA